jgi:shikimate kinase
MCYELNIALFGFMGVGKSVIGKILAEKTGLPFVDLDEEIIKKKGKKISQIFEDEGEKAFREIEKVTTREIAAKDGQIIACGGGTVLDGENLCNLSKNSKMILLTAEPEEILRRVEAEGDLRPLLNVNNKKERVSRLISERQTQYLLAADYIVDTTEWTPIKIAEEIYSYLIGMKSV